MNIGIIGAGSMGSGIAQVAATAGCKVIVIDTNTDILLKAENALRKILGRLVEKGRLSQEKINDIFGNIQYAQDINLLAQSDLIIEAIVENLEVKQNVIRQLETLATDQCILATNTSSLSISAIAASCAIPERVVGIHFFNPAPLMPLVEIVPAIQTSNEVLDHAKNVIDSWGKTTVLAKDTPGFIVNRVARPFYGEALRIYDESIEGLPKGQDGMATIDWAMKEIGGFKMGPFTLMDFIGNDINYAVTSTVYQSFFYDGRYKPSFTQKALSDAGYLGRKTGKGFYDYSENAPIPQPLEDSELGNKIVNRVLIMLINEAADALFWNIATKEAIDLAMTKGVSYPKGLLKWADEIGINNCVTKMDELYEIYKEERYRCSPLLRRMAKGNQKFYS
jgi:3-hydroxybutyryl-CoA dehydrogenase